MVEKRPTLVERVKTEFSENRQERKKIGVLSIGGDLAIEDGVAKFYEYNGQDSVDPDSPYEKKSDYTGSEEHREDRVKLHSKGYEIMESFLNPKEHKKIYKDWYDIYQNLWHHRHFGGYLEFRKKLISEYPEMITLIDREIELYLAKTLYVDRPANPLAIELESQDKFAQQKYIPEKYRLRTWKPGDSPVSKNGQWAVKPRYGSRGERIRFVRDRLLYPQYFGGYISPRKDLIQEGVKFIFYHENFNWRMKVGKDQPRFIRAFYQVQMFSNGNFEIVKSSISDRIHVDHKRKYRFLKPDWVPTLSGFGHQLLSFEVKNKEEIDAVDEAMKSLIANIIDGHLKN